MVHEEPVRRAARARTRSSPVPSGPSTLETAAPSCAREAAPLALPRSIAFLTAYGVPSARLHDAAREARRTGQPPQHVWLARSGMAEGTYFASLAHWLGLPYADRIAPIAAPAGRLPPPGQIERAARVQQGDGLDTRVHVSPDDASIATLARACRRDPRAMARRLVVVPRSSALRAMEARLAPLLLERACEGLSRTMPAFSARQTITPAQMATLILAVQAIGVVAWFASGPLLVAAHVLAGLFFLACALLRLVALLRSQPVQAPSDDALRAVACERLPRYGVLVPLYREAGQVAPLVAALEALEWPADRLDIRFLCELDDEETCRAVAAALADPHRAARRARMRLHPVPARAPRTKPKALSYAMPLLDCDLVVVFDAEDRPHPLQLREAFAAFAADRRGDLACVQAPLDIHNARQGWWARHFALEYRTLFRAFLPALATMRLPIPLGGTSNHFRRSVLDAVGAWDPYNVTEDADLGMRLARAGWRTGTITRPTWEEAPVRFADWLPQRTRWFKGWMQTWLVHMRQPARTARELGWRGTLAFHVLVTGLVVSALVHPLLVWFVARAAFDAARHGSAMLAAHPLLAFDVLTLAAGYGCYLALGWSGYRALPGGTRAIALTTLPLYWLAQSLAAWRALIQLIHRPHHWEKTTHRLAGPASDRVPATPQARLKAGGSASTTSGPAPGSWRWRARHRARPAAPPCARRSAGPPPAHAPG